jgi:ribonuclease HII
MTSNAVPHAKKAGRGRLNKPVQAPLCWDGPGLIAGVDEAGRGPLAGPVVAAAVILDEQHPIRGLADSKKLSASRRDVLFDEIRAKALCFAVAQASVEEIDRLNILQSTLLAMQRAVEGLRLKPTKVLVDGNRLPRLDVLAEAIVKGDDKVPAISAASILAKVTRDRMLLDMEQQFPGSVLPVTRATAPQSIWRHWSAWARPPSTAVLSRQSPASLPVNRPANARHL